MSPNDQSTPLQLDLKGFTPKQYAALILRDELKLSYGRAGIKMGMNHYAFSSLYKRAKAKEKLKIIYV
jgi:DNA-directed RNA polymerase specialized sigma24 family protein